MHTVHNPDGIAGPVAPSYSHAVEVPPGARWLAISGQVGVRPDGTLPADIEGQADQAWQNIVAILGSAGMGLEALVKVTMYVARREDLGGVREVRARYQVDGYRPASTLILVAGLASPAYLIEIEAFAAQ